MYKKILVPLDGSERAEKILPHAKELARKYEATLILLQVLTPLYHFEGVEGPGHYQAVVTEMAELRKVAQAYVSNLSDSLAKEGIDAETQIKEGSPVQSILDVAREEDVDLLAMSSHGRTGVQRVFYGSVTAGVLHATSRPILVIRSEG